MQSANLSNPFAHHPPQSAPQRSNALLWILGAGGILCFICCGGIIGGITYIGIASPETSAYTGNQVPTRFLNTAREVGALDANENVRYFYSDSLFDIREGFYFVSDKKVVIYIEDGRESPLTAIPFDKIADAQLSRDESFFMDSQITLETKDGEFIAFPVSSEFDRDQAFFDVIQDEIR